MSVTAKQFKRLRAIHFDDIKLDNAPAGDLIWDSKGDSILELLELDELEALFQVTLPSDCLLVMTVVEAILCCCSLQSDCCCTGATCTTPKAMTPVPASCWLPPLL